MKLTHSAILAASPWVERFAHALVPGGSVLDLACGGGRHGRLLLDLGHPVTLVDRDTAGVADLATCAGVEILQADLEDGSPWPLGQRLFDAVVITNYLHRPLFADILACIAPGGMLIYETFAVGNERFGQPRNPDFLLRPGELREWLDPALEILACEELTLQQPRPSVVQRVAARRAVAAK